MGFTEDYKMSIYQDYGPLGVKDYIRLVRNKKTGEICVRKNVDYTQQDVINFRKNSNSSYFPKLYEAIEQDAKCILIEEYVNGVTLEDYMMGESLQEEEAVRIACQICKALLELHHATPMIVYRDLKAENIMITSQGDVKLIDFNISRSLKEGQKRDTVLLGTAEYAAPEQFGYFQTDNRTDIYAFGVLFNYMLTGKFPVDYISEGKYAVLIKRCIELEPSKRYQSIDEILVELGGNEQEELEETILNQSWVIPGFRSKIGWKMITAIIGYIFILFVGVTTEYMQEDGTAYPVIMQWVHRIIMILVQVAAVFFACNYRQISDGFGPYKNRFRIVRVFSYMVTWFVSVCTGVFLTQIIETIAGL